jgi:hypothetical protein
MMLRTALLILAFVCFVLATFNVPLPRANLIGLGLAFWVLSELTR